MLHTTMIVKLVVVVKPLSTEAAQGVTFEAGLIRGTRLVVTAAHMFLKLAVGEELVLVGEDLLVSGTQVAHAFFVD